LRRRFWSDSGFSGTSPLYRNIVLLHPSRTSRPGHGDSESCVNRVSWLTRGSITLGMDPSLSLTKNGPSHGEREDGACLQRKGRRRSRRVARVRKMIRWRMSGWRGVTAFPCVPSRFGQRLSYLRFVASPPIVSGPTSTSPQTPIVIGPCSGDDHTIILPLTAQSGIPTSYHHISLTVPRSAKSSPNSTPTGQVSTSSA
jgi:hypothetical protein